MTLTKADIAKKLDTEIGLTTRESKDITEMFFEVICNYLSNGQQVKLSGFGNFRLRNKEARPGRNPKTGESKLVTARRVATFHGGQKLKSQVESFAGKE